jgi:hypothetical protein
VSVRVTLSESIYPADCLEKAVADYSEFCSVEVISRRAGSTEIEIAALVPATSRHDPGRAVNEFLNYLLDLSLERHLEKV